MGEDALAKPGDPGRGPGEENSDPPVRRFASKFIRLPSSIPNSLTPGGRRVHAFRDGLSQPTMSFAPSNRPFHLDAGVAGEGQADQILLFAELCSALGGGG